MEKVRAKIDGKDSEIEVDREEDKAILIIDGKKIVINYNALSKSLRKKSYKIVKCPDSDKFTTFYANLIREPDEWWTALMWEIFKCVRTREVSLGGGVMVRHINVGRPYFLKNALRQALAIGEPFNFFRTSTYIRHTHNGMPADLSKKRIVYGSDYFADFDSDNLDELLSIVGESSDKLSECGIRHSIIFSGKKGFHINVSFKELIRNNIIEKKEEYSREDLTNLFGEMNGLVGSEYIDDRIPGTEFQLQRTPYSIHPETLLMCFPLTKKEFESFDRHKYSLDEVKKINIKNRGVPEWKS
ncbi:MAG TPA: hypothetical protein ENF49_00250 [Candidatus Altiarchaeales archaeon]|nr:hypothetical protein [Candidatus Altiarchaeales archaeon]HEX54549.1 hypothetical protein [Candidatus Altiarchaeales archaeon]